MAASMCHPRRRAFLAFLNLPLFIFLVLLSLSLFASADVPGTALSSPSSDTPTVKTTTDDPCMYITNNGNGQLIVIDESGAIVQQRTVGASPSGIAIKNDLIWIASDDSDRVALFKADGVLSFVDAFVDRSIRFCEAKQIVALPDPYDDLLVACNSLPYLIRLHPASQIATVNVSKVALPPDFFAFGLHLMGDSLFVSTSRRNAILKMENFTSLLDQALNPSSPAFGQIYFNTVYQSPSENMVYGGMATDDFGRLVVVSSLLNGAQTLEIGLGPPVLETFIRTDEATLDEPHDIKRGFSDRYYIPSNRQDWIVAFDSDTGEFEQFFINGSDAGDTLSRPLFMQFYMCPNVTEGSNGLDWEQALSISLASAVPVIICMTCSFCICCSMYFALQRYKTKKRERGGYVVKPKNKEELENDLVDAEGKKYAYREINPAELTFEGLLGKGAFGKVYKGEYRGAPVAIKTFDGIGLDTVDEKLLHEIRREAEMMQKLGNHPNVIGFVGAVTKKWDGLMSSWSRTSSNGLHAHGSAEFEVVHRDPKQEHATESRVGHAMAEHVDSYGNEKVEDDYEAAAHQPAESPAADFFNNFALVVKYCPKGSLFDLLVRQQKELPWVTVVGMARDAAAGILHLHREKVIHRDIAARNCLVDEKYNLFISDFGLARVKEGDIGTTQSNVGPIKWMAPEAIMYREYSEASDAFSFGVLLWEMVTRKVPWAGVPPAQVIMLVTGNTRLKFPINCDPVFRAIMKNVWQENPTKRMKFDKILKRLDDYHSSLLEFARPDSSEDEAEITMESESRGDGTEMTDMQVEVMGDYASHLDIHREDVGISAGKPADKFEWYSVSQSHLEEDESENEDEDNHASHTHKKKKKKQKQEKERTRQEKGGSQTKKVKPLIDEECPGQDSGSDDNEDSDDPDESESGSSVGYSRY